MPSLRQIELGAGEEQSGVSGSHNVVDASHGVDVVLRVERTGDGARLASVDRVLSTTHVLSTHSQSDSLALAPRGLGALGGDDLHTDHVGVGVDEPSLVQPVLIAYPDVLRLHSILNYLKVAGVTGEVQ